MIKRKLPPLSNEELMYEEKRLLNGYNISFHKIEVEEFNAIFLMVEKELNTERNDYVLRYLGYFLCGDSIEDPQRYVTYRIPTERVRYRSEHK